jgi:hypothetical protein
MYMDLQGFSTLKALMRNLVGKFMRIPCATIDGNPDQENPNGPLDLLSPRKRKRQIDE